MGIKFGSISRIELRRHRVVSLLLRPAMCMAFVQARVHGSHLDGDRRCRNREEMSVSKQSVVAGKKHILLKLENLQQFETCTFVLLSSSHLTSHLLAA